MLESSIMNKTLLIVVVALVLSLGSLLLTKVKLTGITQKIQATKPITLDIWVSELVSTRKDLFKVGETTNLIIRNRPHGKLKITDVQCTELSFKRYYFKRLGVEANEVETPMEPIIWQCRLKLTDPNAYQTPNGFVSNGNQLKVANRVNLEGALYYVDGYIVDII